MGTTAREQTLNDLMEIDHVILVHPDGTITDGVTVYAPELHDGELMGDGWTLLDGYSGQQGYTGPIMHSSEYVGGGLERDIRATPGYYVALVDYPYSGDEPDGWAVAHRPVDVETVRLYGAEPDWEAAKSPVRALLFGEMVKRAIPVMKNYLSDLFHDVNYLNTLEGPARFDWVVRHSGSNLGASAGVAWSLGAGPGAVWYSVTLSMDPRGNWSATFMTVAQNPPAS